MGAHAIDAVVASKVPHGSSFGAHIVDQLVEASHSSSEIAHGDEVMLQVLFAVVALGLIGVPLLLLVSSLLPTTDDILESMTQGKDVDAKRASHAELKMGSQMRSSVPTSAGVPTAVLDRLVLQEAQDRIELERSAFVAKEGVKRLVERCPHLKANLGELSNLVDTIISPHESSSDCARPTL